MVLRRESKRNFLSDFIERVPCPIHTDSAQTVVDQAYQFFFFMEGWPLYKLRGQTLKMKMYCFLSFTYFGILVDLSSGFQIEVKR